MMKVNNRVYDVLKFIAQIFLPAAGTLYFALAGLWHLPKPNEVVGSITAVDAFLGMLLGLSSRSYKTSDDRYDGQIEVDSSSENGPTKFSLVLNSDPESLIGMKTVSFKVVDKSQL